MGADAGALRRLMRALVAFGIFRQAGPDRYAHSEASRAMRSDAEVSRTDIMLTGGDWGWAMWGKLAQSVPSGTCAFQVTYGKDLFTYFHEDDNAAGAACLKPAAVTRGRDGGGGCGGGACLPGGARGAERRRTGRAHRDADGGAAAGRAGAGGRLLRPAPERAGELLPAGAWRSRRTPEW